MAMHRSQRRKWLLEKIVNEPVFGLFNFGGSSLKIERDLMHFLGCPSSNPECMETHALDIDTMDPFADFLECERYLLGSPISSIDMDQSDDSTFAFPADSDWPELAPPDCFTVTHAPSVVTEKRPLPMPEFPRHKRNKQESAIAEEFTSVRFKRALIPDTAIREISSWIRDNRASPYPTHSKKVEWCDRYSLSMQTLNIFLTNRRRRILGKTSERQRYQAVPAFMGTELGVLYLQI